MLRQYELVDRVLSYDPEADAGLLNRAYTFSVKAHGTQKRASGDPYFTHPVEVAAILADLRLDTNTIAAALLHATIEETVATREDIKREFGENVAQLVDGVTTLSKIEARGNSAGTPLDMRRYLQPISDDIRVLLVKLADRLHDMRTLHLIGNEKKRRHIVDETMEIYAPLAERIGMYDLMMEMQGLAFRDLEPEAYEAITKRLDSLKGDGEERIAEIASSLKLLLSRQGIKVDVRLYQKQAYSIWRKMSQRHMALEQLTIMAFQLSVENVEQAYRALGVIQQRWPMIPGSFKDYMSTPKLNGYRALHTTIVHSGEHRVEIHICTPEMRSRADLGLAAHWFDKQSSIRPDPQVAWKKDLVELLEFADDPERTLEHAGHATAKDTVLAFTPAGEMIQLPRGATPIDFAYAVHSELGHQTAGAKINGRNVPLRTAIQQGDKVQILSSGAQEPQADWLNIVVTHKARAAIRRHLRQSGDPDLASAEAIMPGSEPCITPRAAESIMRQAASPQIIRKGNKIDAINGAFESDDGVPLEWLPKHLRDCAYMLHAGVAQNASNRLLAPLEIYAKAIDENPRSPIVQTLIFCASMIELAMDDSDFPFWANQLDRHFTTFLTNHRRLVDHFPELETRQAMLAELPIDYSADIGSALSKFILLSADVLKLLVEANFATERAEQILDHQLALAKCITGPDPLPANDGDQASAEGSWTPVHDQAVNSLGVWIQVRDNLSESLAGGSHPELREVLPSLVSAISQFIETFVHLTKK